MVVLPCDSDCALPASRGDEADIDGFAQTVIKSRDADLSIWPALSDYLMTGPRVAGGRGQHTPARFPGVDKETDMKGTNRVISRDGTTIAFDRTGQGPPVIMVEAAGHFRGFSSFDGLVPLLSREFTVYTYDRRGRGESTDSTPYAPEREVEDLEALIAESGGGTSAYGYSSGALLALQAAAHGVPLTRLALLEPPLQEDGAVAPDPLTAELAELVAAGRRSDAVEHFQQSIGVPTELIDEMRGTPQWASMESVAHTLVYDCTIIDTTTSTLLRSVVVPTLVLDSEDSTDNLTGWAERVARQLPHASHRSLAGEWHSIPDDVLAPVLVEFFTAVE